MKLTGVKTYVVKTDPPNWGGILWFFVKLETDEGIEGWGETAVLGCLVGLEDSYEKRVREIFDRYLRDKDPIDREPLYQTLYSSLTAQHPDYVALGLISASTSPCGTSAGSTTAPRSTTCWVENTGTGSGPTRTSTIWMQRDNLVSAVARLVDQPDPAGRDTRPGSPTRVSPASSSTR